MGEPGIIVFDGMGGVEGDLMTDEDEDEGEIALENVVEGEGTDVGSSSEIKCAPSSALSSSSADAPGILVTPADDNEG